MKPCYSCRWCAVRRDGRTPANRHFCVSSGLYVFPETDPEEDCKWYEGMEAESEPSQVARDIATIIENEQDMRVISKQKTGRWIENKGMIYCSECANGFDKIFIYNYNYCPNCGAKMEAQDDIHGED